MKKANPELFRDLSIFIDGLRSMKKEKAFEVACGECHVTRKVLAMRFNRIDLLDQCPKSIVHAQNLRKVEKKVKDIHQCRMQEF